MGLHAAQSLCDRNPAAKMSALQFAQTHRATCSVGLLTVGD